MNVRIGGLYRCCIEEVRDKEGQEQDVHTCPHCNEEMIFKDGAWEWRRHTTSFKKGVVY